MKNRPATLSLACALLLASLGAPALEAGGGPEENPQAAEVKAAKTPYDQLSLEELLRVRIVTASQQDESLREAPVPVTVITSDMIRAIGARNLLDVLLAYVPGMTLAADHNEVNVAMRGVYASSQQKILVMLDGHRLNSRAYSMANPDYSIRIDLDRVKQIEVLRGPGSSLYGNVALTAVVNIVTRSGEEIDGIAATVGAGGFLSGQDADSGQGVLAAGRSLGLTYGKEFSERSDLVMWGGVFEADGQRIPVSRAEDYSPNPKDGYAIVDGFKDGASYDLGLKYRSGVFTLLGNLRSGKLVEPFSAGGLTGEVYDSAQYRSLRNLGPGLSSQSGHLELEYAPSLSERLSLELTGYYDTNDLAGVLVTDPSKARYSFIHWMEDAVGGIGQATWSYKLGRRGQGTLLAGAQVDHMRLLDSDLEVGENGQWVRFGDTSATPLLQRGSETTYSGFVQLKHRFNEEWIVNGGFRLDVKDRHQGAQVTDLSPRVGLVWVPSAAFDLKLSYAQSFVDAPYWYRYNVFPSYQGSQDLRPEHLTSIQITPTLTSRQGRLRNSLNLFYNEVTDFVFRNKSATGSEPRYANAGLLKSAGVEHELAWVQETYSVRGALTFQHVLESSLFDAREGEIYNVPRLGGSLVVDARPFGKPLERVGLNLALRYVGEQLAPIAPTFKLVDGKVVPFQDPDNRVGSSVLVNLGVRAGRFLFDGVSLEATVYNLLDKRYLQGGSVVHPYPQAGRSLVVRLTYRS